MIWFVLFFHALANNLFQLSKIPVYKLTRTRYGVTKMAHGIIAVEKMKW